MVNTYGDLYLYCRKALTETEGEQYASELARQVVCFFSGITSANFLMNRNEPVSEEVVCQVEKAVQRLLQQEPLAYVLGEWDFYGLTLRVSPDVLIPRDDTCAVTELAIHQGLFLGEKPRILDLCTGSGCIGLAVASHIPDARVTLADVSQSALKIARQNVNDLKLSSRVSCVEADALNPAPAFLGTFDLIVSNPPYITEEEMKELPESVDVYEPHLALFGGVDGLVFYRSITENYGKCLKPGGFLCFEFGMGQGNAVCEILENNGFTVLERKNDFNGRERAVLARKS